MSSTKGGSSSWGNKPNTLRLRMEEEIVVGFDDEAERIKEQLIGGGGGQNQLQIISIVGMAGIGKTTLAQKVYDDPLIIYYFHVHAWINISQEYRKRDLLLATLSCFVELTEKIYKMSDVMIGQQLYKRLKGKKYLIVMDDIWNIEAWDELKIVFPNDNNGSRIIFTSRLANVALCAKFASPPHFLRFLTEEESWQLFQHKVFRGETCPPELIEIGMQISKKCQRLPLAIVVVAGILAKQERQLDLWKCILETLSSYINGDPQYCMETLALSYNHLPHHLKPCFLYFGAFPEDYEIPVQKLIWLWIAEGFIQQIGQKSLEDVAEEYLMNLVDRSLVLVSSRRSDSRIKACRIHDLLRDFCLRKAKEENFLQQISSHQNASPSKDYGPNQQHLRSSGLSCCPSVDIQRRLCIHSNIMDCLSLFSSTLNICSILCFAPRRAKLLDKHTPFHCQGFKLLRVLDISLIYTHFFPSEIVKLLLLKYLSIRGSLKFLPASISNLVNLETIILYAWGSVGLPLSIWKMVKLRHLCIKYGTWEMLNLSNHNHDFAYSSFLVAHLENLQTLSYLFPCLSCQDVLERIPNIKKLALDGQITSMPDLSFCVHLENLKLLNTGPLRLHGSIYSQHVELPQNLKKLTLLRTLVEWEALSTLGMLLPKLEVLKLRAGACIGLHWETSIGAFPQLKFLQLQSLNIVQWSTSSNHFPCLQKLVINNCENLEVVPSGLGDIPTLQLIEVRHCGHAAENSARKIKEEQESIGNKWLRILVA